MSEKAQNLHPLSYTGPNMLKSAGTTTTEEVSACAERARGCLETLSARSIYYSGFRHYNNVWFWVLPSYFPIVLPFLLSNIKGLKHFLMILYSKAIHYNTLSVLLSWGRIVHAITQYSITVLYKLKVYKIRQCILWILFGCVICTSIFYNTVWKIFYSNDNNLYNLNSYYHFHLQFFSWSNRSFGYTHLDCTKFLYLLYKYKYVVYSVLYKVKIIHFDMKTVAMWKCGVHTLTVITLPREFFILIVHITSKRYVQ